MRTESWPALLPVSHPHPVLLFPPSCGPGTWRTAPSGTRRTCSRARRMASPRQTHSGPRAPARGAAGCLTHTPGEGTRPLWAAYAPTHSHASSPTHALKKATSSLTLVAMHSQGCFPIVRDAPITVDLQIPIFLFLFFPLFFLCRFRIFLFNNMSGFQLLEGIHYLYLEQQQYYKPQIRKSWNSMENSNQKENSDF